MIYSEMIILCQNYFLKIQLLKVKRRVLVHVVGAVAYVIPKKSIHFAYVIDNMKMVY